MSNTILTIITILVIIGLIFAGYQLRGSDLEYKAEACDEYCFHYAEEWASNRVGFRFSDGKCICDDGSIGWFD